MEESTHTVNGERGFDGAKRRAGEAITHARDVLGTWSSGLRSAVDADLAGLWRAFPERAEEGVDALLARIGLARIAKVEAERAATQTAEAPAEEMTVSDAIAPAAEESLSAEALEAVSTETVAERASEEALAEVSTETVAERAPEAVTNGAKKSGRRRR